MDINTFRSLATVLALIAFVSIVVWAYSSRRKKDFDEAANIPFADVRKTAVQDDKKNIENTDDLSVNATQIKEDPVINQASRDQQGTDK